jgi:hypothetical protein
MRPINQAGKPFGLITAQPQIHRGTRHPANAATCFFNRPSAYHNTIRARVATGAATSALFTTARWPTVSFTGPSNTTTNQK